MRNLCFILFGLFFGCIFSLKARDIQDEKDFFSENVVYHDPDEIYVAHGDTLAYSPGYDLKIPQIINYAFSDDPSIFPLPSHQYVFVKSPTFSRRERVESAKNDTILTPDSAEIVDFILNKGISQQIYEIYYMYKHRVDSVNDAYEYLNSLVLNYEDNSVFVLNDLRVNRIIRRNGYEILLFNFLPEEIAKCTLYTSQIKMKEPSLGMKQWLKRYFCD